MDKVSATRSRTTSAIVLVFLCLGFLIVPSCAPMGSDSDAENPAAAAELIDVYLPQQGIDSKQRFRLVLELLESGDSAAARAELQLYLQEKPSSSRAQDLLKQIDTPSTEYFTQDYRELTLSSGQSLSSVAKTFLGSVYKFHALAKYNGILEPGKIGTGQTIRVPLTEGALSVFQALDNAPIATAQDPVSETEMENSIEEILSEPENEAIPEPESTVKFVEAEVEFPEDPANADIDTAAAPDVEEMHLEALNAYRAQDLSKAIELWDRVLAIDPEFESSRLYRSQAIKLQKKLLSFD